MGESSASAAAPTTPLSSGSSEEAEAGGRKDGVDMDTMADAALGGGAPASTAAPRTIIVKERVKEERTFQDARGYLVCEEVWVEREVEREVKEAPAKPKASFSQLAQPKAKERPKLTGLKANKGKEAKGMEEVDAEEEEEKKKNKGKGKGKAAPAPAKVVTGAGSIMGFFKRPEQSGCGAKHTGVGRREGRGNPFATVGGLQVAVYGVRRCLHRRCEMRDYFW